MSLELFTQPVGPVQTNAFLLHETRANTLVVVDPAIGADELFERAQQLVSGGARFEAIWNTHGHFDHIYDNARWKTAFNAPIYAHPGDAYFLEHLREQSLWFGLPAPEIAPIDVELREGDVLRLGDERASVWELPGHSPGSVAFGFDEFWLVGDVLFQGSVGRTDLYGGDARTLARSIQRLWTLPDATRILTGHGDQTTIGIEKQENEVARALLINR
jgi:hydroxyacylglutathione hydrolase